MSTFREKYLKYKMKYIQLKNQLGGVCDCGKSRTNANCPRCSTRKAPASQASSSSAAASNPRFASASAAASSAAAANARDINVIVTSMSGASAQFQISNNATILELKRLIQTKNEFAYLEIYRQKLVYRPGPYGMESLANERTLVQCGIGEVDGNDPEVDLLVEPNLLTFAMGVVNTRIVRLMKEEKKEELAYLLSQYTGELDLGGYYVSDVMKINAIGAITLAHALRENTTVTNLNLRFNIIGNEGAQAIADMLAVNTKLTHLSLESNQIGDEGAHALANALKVNSTLTSIVLGYNRIGDVGAHHIADMMRNNTTIINIYLGNNQFGAEGIAELEAVKASRPRGPYDNFIITMFRQRR